MTSDASVPIIHLPAQDSAPGADDDLLDAAIGALYSTTGTTEQKVFRTTAEVLLEISDVMEAELGAVARWMKQHQCDTRVIDGTLCWVLYDLRDPSCL